MVEDLSRRLELAPYSAKPLRTLARLGLRVRPEQLADLLLRTGPIGDLFGLRRGGLRLERLREHPHGLVLADEIATGVLAGKLRAIRVGRLWLSSRAWLNAYTAKRDPRGGKPRGRHPE